MKDYFVGNEANLSRLEARVMPQEIYAEAHRGIAIGCHDAIIEHSGGALLVVRKQDPAKGLIWPIGGRILRGIPTEESLKIKIRKECGLESDEITYLGVARFFADTDPFGHGGGTDTISLWYFVRGIGEIKLNHEHEAPMIVTPEKYTLLRDSLHPYVRDFMDLAMPLIRG